jgi:hypothetical protein
MEFQTIIESENVALRLEIESLKTKINSFISENEYLKDSLQKLFSLIKPKEIQIPRTPWQEKLKLFETLESVCEEYLDLTNLITIFNIFETANVPKPCHISWDKDDDVKYFVIEWETTTIMFDVYPQVNKGSIFYINSQREEIFLKDVSFHNMISLIKTED